MIRRAGPGDVDALRAIAAAAYRKYVPRIGRALAPMTAGGFHRVFFGKPIHS
jgi:hypothetical protein